MATTPTAAPAAPAANTAPQTETNTAPVENAEAEGEETEESASPEAAASGTPTAGAPTTQSAIKKALKQLKYKVDGREYNEELPFEIPDDPKAIEYMQRQIQLGRMGQSRAQQYTELQKQVGSFLQRLQTDPKGALSDPNIGVDVKQLARQVIEEEIANSQKSPEQLAKEQLEAEIKQLREQDRRREEEFKQKEFERATESAYEAYDTQIDKALSGSDLPKSPYVIKKFAEYLMIGLQKNQDLTAEDVLPLVQQEIQDDIKAMFAASPDEMVEKMVGKEKINSLRKKKIAKAVTPPAPVTKSVKDVGANTKKEAAPAKAQTYKEFFKI